MTSRIASCFAHLCALALNDRDRHARLSADRSASSREIVLRKIRALLQKTVANGCLAEEALATYAKAQALMTAALCFYAQRVVGVCTMKKLLTATVAALAMLATVPTAQAAQFWTAPGFCSDGSKTCIDVHMQGEIVKGDNARFNKAVAKVPKGKATIFLDSIGGEFLEGFPIAKTVRRQNWNTYVDHYCTSMCADIWLAGNVRYYRRLAQIGFHTVSQLAGKGSTAGVKWRGKYWVRNAVDDALVLKFFQEIGISAKTARILLAPDLGHLTWVNGWGSDPALVASLNIKMTMWEKGPANVVTVPASTLPKQSTHGEQDLNAALQRIELERASQPRIFSEPSAPPSADQASGSRRSAASTNAGSPDGSSHPPTSEDGAASRIPQRVVLYEDEDPSDPKGKQYVGSVVWRTEPIQASGNQPADVAVRADIDISDRKFKMTMSFRRNTDSSLPASHTVEVTFILPQDFSGGGVANVPGILMKSNEQARGTPLAGLAVKVTDGFFLIGLSNVDADRSRNTQLLKERSWFDIPLVYASQRRAIVAIEKGPPGERAFADAFGWSSENVAGEPALPAQQTASAAHIKRPEASADTINARGFWGDNNTAPKPDTAAQVIAAANVAEALEAADPQSTGVAAAGAPFVASLTGTVLAKKVNDILGDKYKSVSWEAMCAKAPWHYINTKEVKQQNTWDFMCSRYYELRWKQHESEQKG